MMFSFRRCVFIASGLFVAACSGKPADVKDEPGKSKLSSLLPDEDTASIPPVQRWTTIVDLEHVKIAGNPDLDASMIQSVKVKFQPYVWFDDFPAPVIDTVTKAPLDFRSNEAAKNYITAIRNGYKEEYAAFGGHYILVHWGCGSPCYNGVIVDRQTGKLYDLPESAVGYECRPESRMLIVNPADEDGCYDLLGEFYIAPTLYLFDEEKKTFALLPPKGRG